ncbi:SMC-Scp complex subunit ScpB [Pseudalkalibacillus berkeleyi]|uniref:Segregation and condensation protein B n=1 Tax=Pseudalkalibacillus berkeleyi TaxID=1069813 RepID=A0ABS9H1G2_9BACL|nr:SMC-Scp complex subunit ScpB [Pseudalkalibacillus berkeleyi]MCF6137632.1 SMC-Scp complex subunit ScpB [Pseudalkalibacillus berkeleyi]
MTTRIEQKAIIEGLLFVVGDEGLESKQAADILQIEQSQAESIIQEMKQDYQSDERGIEIVEIAGGYQFSTKAKHINYYEKFVESPTTGSLSQAALETLAIIAYKQPITRAEIEDIRGVKTEKPLQTLASKELVKEVGRAEGTGRAILYGTTRDFLEYFGLKTIEDLPHLPDHVEDDSIETEADLFFENFQNAIGPNNEEE